MLVNKMKTLTALITVGVLIFLSACQGGSAAPGTSSNGSIGTQVKVDGGTYTDLTANELNKLLDQKDFLLVNVHIPLEGNLPKTDLSIPYDTITQNLAQLPTDKNAKIVLYCRSGHMSSIAAKELVKLGYTHISELAGGMAAWQQAGYTVNR